MKTMDKRIVPEEFVLSILSPEERLDAALKIANVAFKETTLTLKDVEQAVGKIRRKAYAKK